MSHGHLCSRSSPRGGGAALRNAAEDHSRQRCARRPAGTAQSPGGGAGPSGGFAAAQRLTRPPATPITAGGGRGGVGVEPSRRCPSRISGGRVHGCDSPGRVLIGCPAVTDRPRPPRRRGTVVRRAEAARGPLCAGTDCAARGTAGTRGWGGVCGAPRSLHGAVTSRSPAARPRTLAGRFPAHRPVTSLRTCPPRPLQRRRRALPATLCRWAGPARSGRGRRRGGGARDVTGAGPAAQVEAARSGPGECGGCAGGRGALRGGRCGSRPPSVAAARRALRRRSGLPRTAAPFSPRAAVSGLRRLSVRARRVRSPRAVCGWRGCPFPRPHPCPPAVPEALRRRSARGSPPPSRSPPAPSQAVPEGSGTAAPSRRLPALNPRRNLPGRRSPRAAFRSRPLSADVATGTERPQRFCRLMPYFPARPGPVADSHPLRAPGAAASPRPGGL